MAPRGGNGSAATLVPNDGDGGQYCGQGIVLQELSTRLAHVETSQRRVDERAGEILVMATRSVESAERAERAALSAMRAAERTERAVNEPINAMLAKYQQHVSSAPPPPIDWGDDAGEVTKTQDVRTILKRAKTAEKSRGVIIALTPIALAVIGLVELWLRLR